MIVLDTHVLIWWLNNPKELSPKALRSIEAAKKKNAIYVSSISIWEIYMLVQKKRLVLNTDIDSWMDTLYSISYLNFFPVDNKVAAVSVQLQGYSYPDPADRMIVATSLTLKMPLVTKDGRLRKYKGVVTVW